MTAATRRAFVDALFASGAGDGLIELRALPSARRAFVARDDHDAIDRFIATHASENLYVAIATRRDTSSGALDNCASLSALFVDIDFKQTPEPAAREGIAKFPLAPSAVVASGGGVHVYYLLREPLDLPAEAATAKALLRRLAGVLGGDLAAAEPVRVLRLPGTLNRKPEYGAPRPVTLETLEPDRRYNLSELDDVLTPEPEPTADGAAAPFVLPDRILAHEPGRNHTLWRYGRSLKAKGWKLPRVLAELERVNRERCEPPLPDHELGDVAHNVITEADRPTFAARRNGADAEEPSSGHFHLTDAGNAQRFARDHGRDVRYCYAWAVWLVWDGRRLARDPGDGIMARAKATARAIYAEAAAEADAERRKARAAWARTSERAERLRAMLALAQSEPGIPVTPDELDRDPFALNVANGTLDLRTGELRAHRREDLVTKLAPVAYDASATCPRFLAFLGRIMNSDAERIAFLQRALGYSLTGDTREQCFFVPWGAGANGKTTLTRTVFRLLGDYAAGTRADAFMVKYGDTIPNDIARLKGARFVLASEAEENQRLAESLVKGITGGDVLTARFMRSEYFDFVPALKLWLATNHRPVIRGTDHAMWRRVRLIPFTVTIPDAERDATLSEKLAAEAPGILAWLVAGCRAWRGGGLSVPESVRAATGEYRAAMDVLGAFIAERCAVDADGTIAARELYAEYAAWCMSSNEKPITRKAFGLRLAERGFTATRTEYERAWHGLRLRTPLDPTDPEPAPAPGEERNSWTL
ncbi:MAG: phage/plasmid primase, P4 family [Burkholderiales bacterium]